MTDPREWEELTPEQQAALVEFGRLFVEHIEAITEAFQQFGAACAEATHTIEAIDWPRPTDPGESP